jgi:NagD protein
MFRLLEQHLVALRRPPKVRVRPAASKLEIRRAAVSILDGIDAVVLDIDGTLLHAHDPGGVHGAQPIPGAIETVERVRASGRRLLFFTNGTGKPPADYAADLRALGFALEDAEFMNPAVVAARWIARKHPGKTVLVLGGHGVVAPLHELGIATIPRDEPGRADVVLVGWDDTLTYAGLRAACDSVWAGAPLLATSTATVFSVQGGPAPGWSGAVVAGIRQITGARAVTLGKPSPEALREMCRALGVRPARTLVVGDDLDLEIAMARRAGARCVLVLTGTGTRAAAEARPAARRPDLIVEDVTALSF